MVTPADILTVATLIAALPGEAAARKSVSAAYYAAYSHAASLGRVRSRPQHHRHVARALRLTDPAAAASLQALRELRIRADYQLLEDFSENALSACALAESILALV